MIHIKKNGFFVLERNTELKTEGFKKVENQLSYHLQDMVSIDEDVTVENLMNILSY